MTEPRQQSANTSMAWRAIATRSLLFAGVWWVLTGGGAKAWPLGAVMIVLALLVSLRLLPPGPHRVSLIGLGTFFGFFMGRSVIAGVQVAMLALRPRLDLHPLMVELPTRLPHEAERVFLANIITLMPGTLSAGLDGKRLRLHVLDARLPVEKELRAVEQRVARLFGVELQ